MSNIFESNKNTTTEDGRLLYNFFSLLYIFGGAVPYIPQYLKIRKTQSIKGFSSFVCFILLISNILRILFWFVQPFPTSLLFQSFIMIATMLILLRTITQLSGIKRSPSMPCTISIRKAETESWNINQFKDIWFRNFWKWTHFSNYLLFLCLFTLISGLCTYLLSSSQIYVQLLGFTALFIESMLGLPQFTKNFYNKSIVGMSISMVLMWTSGDVFKTIYFILENAPLQFLMCGLLQIGLDLAILLQCLCYRGEGFT
ncbi:unnamed protein product [Schistosoma rodhaini]|uniref:Solute carrier family 66 member 2 n=1 Tax=Schistosoma mansoni TaxID=6183 RepID=G4VNB1_SCHMA|nr:hypothetical protein Smp_147370 [Schistosoma mansoni]CAH8672680.1 unnamed protein product [Schistosoma rodhaini]|eukprot:XP_018654730.1 hypothetical protein Smp_147370 [Schistosoma mansoni]